MHIEKNICDSLLGTIVNIVEKSKDMLKARLGLCEMRIRTSLLLVVVGNKTYTLPECYIMNRQERNKLCTLLKHVRFLDRYSLNISHCVNLKDRKIGGLKGCDHFVVI